MLIQNNRIFFNDPERKERTLEKKKIVLALLLIMLCDCFQVFTNPNEFHWRSNFNKPPKYSSVFLSIVTGRFLFYIRLKILLCAVVGLPPFLWLHTKGQNRTMFTFCLKYKTKQYLSIHSSINPSSIDSI